MSGGRRSRRGVALGSFGPALMPVALHPPLLDVRFLLIAGVGHSSLGWADSASHQRSASTGKETLPPLSTPADTTISTSPPPSPSLFSTPAPSVHTHQSKMAEVNPKAYPLADAQLTITILDIVQQAAVRDGAEPRRTPNEIAFREEKKHQCAPFQMTFAPSFGSCRCVFFPRRGGREAPWESSRQITRRVSHSSSLRT